MTISTQYGASPDFFGQADYDEAIRQGYTPAEILQWMNSNIDKLQNENAPGSGGLYDNVLNSVFNEANNTPSASTLYQQAGINAQIIPLEITDQYDFKTRPTGGVSYDRNNKSWSLTKEATDYKTDYKTNYIFNRKIDYPTDAKANYAIPDFLPTNLSANLPTTLKTDYKTDYPTNLTEPEAYWELVPRYKNGRMSFGYEARIRQVPKTGINNQNRALNESNDALNKENTQTNADNAAKNLANNNQNLTNDGINNKIQIIREKYTILNRDNANTNVEFLTTNTKNQQFNTFAQQVNKKNQELNEENTLLNNKNTASNKLYDKTVALASTTQGGDYVSQRDQISPKDLINAGFSVSEAQEVVDNLKTQYKLFYRTEKLIPWDSSLGVQPPYGTFDPAYYKKANPVVNAAWNKAVAIDDIDITERYGENNYYWQHYTTTGKAQGLRGNEGQELVAAKRYQEKTPTDQEIQTIRDLQLGVDTDTITQRLLNVPEVSNQWTKARQGDPYWKQLAKDKYLDVNKPEEFAVLFRLSNRPEDKQIILSYNINTGSGITELEDAINTAINTKKTVDVKKFAAINQTILKDAIAEMKKQKGRQEMMNFFRGFRGFTEVVDVNRDLTNSILGDTGVGGVLAFTSGGKAEERLLKGLQNVTGMRNNIVYNWQQWFDQSIKNKYGIDYSLFEPLEEKKDIINAFINSTVKAYDANKNEFSVKFLEQAGFTSTQELINFLGKQGTEGETILNAIKGEPGEKARLILQPINSRLEADIKTLDATKNRGLALAYNTENAIEMMNIEAQFARNYLDEYLIPRFNTSKSMDEFIEYLDIRQEERNPFEISDIDQSLKKLGQLQSQLYLDKVKQQGPRSFDSDFYFNPTGDRSRTNQYADQKKTIEDDWAAAKAGDSYWANQAYRFGIDINNKAAFARMHFEVKGQGKGYDAAEDITNSSKVQDFISINVMPLIQKEANKAEVVFGTFITPEEFADEMLRGLDPTKTPDAWKEVIQRFGLSEFVGTIDELKQYIVETLRSGSAQEIREQIKYLNDKRQRPTQEILGITYIEKKEDYKDEKPKPTTQLYSIFQQAGYQGTEDEFYDNMFPDLNRSEQVLLTKAGKDTALKTYGLDLQGPFASLGTIESFFPEDQAKVDKEIDKETTKDFHTRYFRIDEDQKEEELTKSNAGQAFLGEFTSMFKGL
jgi:hypothetical protein